MGDESYMIRRRARQPFFKEVFGFYRISYGGTNLEVAVYEERD